MKKKKILEKEYLETRLKYEPLTGKLYWLYSDMMSKRWNNRYAGKEAFVYKNIIGYKVGGLDNNTFLAHRIIYKMINNVDAEEVDHINGDRSDNRAINLRASNKSTNQMNARKKHGNYTSKYKGVRFFPRDKNWCATCNRKHIGYFINEHDAAIAYNNEARKVFGDFAKLNIIRYPISLKKTGV